MNCRACGKRKQIWDGPGFCRECLEEGRSRIAPEQEAKREEKVGCSNCGSTEGPAYEFDYGVDRETGYHDCGVLCHECRYPGIHAIPEVDEDPENDPLGLLRDRLIETGQIEEKINDATDTPCPF